MRSLSFGWLGIAAAALAATSAHALALPPIISLPPTPTGVKNHHRKVHTSKYMPHQGKRECARRVRQMEKRHV